LHHNSYNEAVVYTSLGGNVLDGGVDLAYLRLTIIWNIPLRAGLHHNKLVAVEADEKYAGQ
jgi:hypothetical protein